MTKDVADVYQRVLSGEGIINAVLMVFGETCAYYRAATKQEISRIKMAEIEIRERRRLEYGKSTGSVVYTAMSPMLKIALYRLAHKQNTDVQVLIRALIRDAVSKEKDKENE